VTSDLAEDVGHVNALDIEGGENSPPTLDTLLFSDDRADPWYAADPGEDGDDTDDRPAGIRDILDAGHGFLVQGGGSTAYRPTHCEVCGKPLNVRKPGEGPEWLCQLTDDENQPARLDCPCNWCLHYQMWLNGSYQPQGGRPPQRCGSKECNRKAAAQRKQKQRARERADQRGVTETHLRVEGNRGRSGRNGGGRW
jgi:hypothetical protein